MMVLVVSRWVGWNTSIGYSEELDESFGSLDELDETPAASEELDESFGSLDELDETPADLQMN